MAIESNEGTTLPEDLMIEVLSWLPVKMLLQLKCVCKSWCAIITSSNFISKHLNNYYNSSENGCLLAQYFTRPYPYLLELFPDENLEVLSYRQLDLPIPEASICGPCNGLFYLYGWYPEDSFIWNPATDEIKVLPTKITAFNLPPHVSFPLCICGFGLDPVTNDYKVIAIPELWDDQRAVEYLPFPITVYSIRSDSWRCCGDLRQFDILDDNGCYSYDNGVFYWWGSKGEKRVIISFDMVTDMLGEIPVPDYEKPAQEKVALFHNSIALFTFHAIAKFFNIWVMSTEGCWKKQFNVDLGPLVGVQRLIGYWKNGKVFLESETNTLILCDPSTQEVKGLEFLVNGGPGVGDENPFPDDPCCQILNYKESLVSIKGWNIDR